MSTKTLITSESKKGRHAVQLFRIAYDGAQLDTERAQKLNERGDEFQDGIGKLIAELTTSNQFADEEVSSTYEYPKEYKGSKPIEEQIKALAKILDLDPTQALKFAKSLPKLPVGAEGWFAIPSVDALAKKHFPKVTDMAEKYCQALQLIHKKVADSRSFYNYREGKITPAHLRVTFAQPKRSS